MENFRGIKTTNTLDHNRGLRSSSGLLGCKTNSVHHGPSKTKASDSILLLQKKFPMAARVKVDATLRVENSRHAPVPQNTDVYPSARLGTDAIGSVVDWHDDVLVSHDKENACSNDSDCFVHEPDHPDEHFQPSLTIKDALKDGGWTLKRSSKHLVYRRDILDKSGKVREIVITMGKTNSDRRADKNTLARLNKFNRRYAKSAPTVIVGRHCTTCGEYKPKTGFSTKQWNTGKNKCKSCLA
eukprot:scaffold1428_cov159-Amphora_coffeaeformis.AAC.13